MKSLGMLAYGSFPIGSVESLMHSIRHRLSEARKTYLHALAIGEPPHLSEVETAKVHAQIERMGYGQAADGDGVGDVPRAMDTSKREVH